MMRDNSDEIKRLCDARIYNYLMGKVLSSDDSTDYSALSEYDKDFLDEDMLQVNIGDYTVDLGWYRGNRFAVKVFKAVGEYSDELESHPTKSGLVALMKYFDLIEKYWEK